MKHSDIMVLQLYLVATPVAVMMANASDQNNIVFKGGSTTNKTKKLSHAQSKYNILHLPHNVVLQSDDKHGNTERR